MEIKKISPPEARDLMTGPEAYAYIDVRSIPEFTAGHPEGAVNIPLLHLDEAQGGMVPNPDFLKVAEANFPKEARLAIGCQVGMRSQKAAEILAEAGYQSVCNVWGGFGGLRDNTGQLVAQGWQELGLPVSMENSEGVSYESLASRAKP
jgi:rhodanese-related sulfurtransferase